MEYNNIVNFENNENNRKNIFVFYCVKTFKDIGTYLIVFPLNMLTIYYIPLF
jgi:hypothetical protein